MNPTATETAPDVLREKMVARVKEVGYALTPAIEQAMLSVERHLFVPDASLDEAYANDIVVTKQDDDQVLSCASSPSIVGLQLLQLDVQPGHRMLEIGAGTGYNAALLAHLAGPTGHVTAIDVDADIVEQARQRLATAGVDNVEVVLGDGAVGYQANAPYDRIIATVGAYGLPDSWFTQLVPGGRLVVPTRIRGSVSNSIAFERDAVGVWRSVDQQLCGFVPLRKGIADDPRRIISLTDDNSVKLQLNQEHTIDPAGLVGILDRPRTEVWTDVIYPPMESVEKLYFWLTCNLKTSLCWMKVDQSAIDEGLIQPMFRGGAMAVPGHDGIAYLTWRTVGQLENGRICEVGVIGHGDSELAHQVAAEIRNWNEHHRNRTFRFEIPPSGTDISDPAAGRYFLDRPHHPLTVIWD